MTVATVVVASGAGPELSPTTGRVPDIWRGFVVGVELGETDVVDTEVLPVAIEVGSTSPPTALADRGELRVSDASEHPVRHSPGQRVAVGEVLVRFDGQLLLFISGPVRGRPTAPRPAAECRRPSS